MSAANDHEYSLICFEYDCFPVLKAIDDISYGREIMDRIGGKRDETCLAPNFQAPDPARGKYQARGGAGRDT